MAYNQGYYAQGTYQQGYAGWQQPQYGQTYTGQYAAPTPDPYNQATSNNWDPPAGVPMYAGQTPDAYAANAQWGQPQQGYTAGAYQQPAYGYGQQYGYAAPQPGAYAAPQPGYAAPQQGYGAYQQPTGAYAQPGYTAPAQYSQATIPPVYPTSQPAAYPTSVAQQPQGYAQPVVPQQPVSLPPAQVASQPAYAPPASVPAEQPIVSSPPPLMAQPTVSSPPPLMAQPTVSSAPPLLAQPTVSSAPPAVTQPTVSASPPPLLSQPTVGSAPAGLSSPTNSSLGVPPMLQSQQSVNSIALGARAGLDTDVTQPGRLFLEVVGGRNLKNMELFGKQDPYMKLNFKAYKLRTKTHHSGGRFPVWNQTFSFELDGKDPDIAIECYDEDTTKDDFIGGASVNIQQIVNGRGSEVWVPIVSKKGVNTGEVAFKAKFAQYRPAILKFKLVDAKGLPCPDNRKLSPYVIFYVDGDKANKVLAKSRVHKDGGANPTWNQDFNFKLSGREQFLDLDVWDEDVAADDHCGNARLRFVDLRQAPSGTQRFPLTRPGKQSTATIGVSVEFAPIS